MNEAFLHYIWNTRQFDLSGLRLTDGRRVEILGYGKLNAADSGPDFLNGSIRVDGLTFAGNIELHIKASEWYQHRHDRDAAYDNVILHVVWDEDAPVHNRSAQPLPTLVLKNRIAKDIFRHYQYLMRDPAPIHCHALQPQQVPAERWAIWKERLLIERLQRKVAAISASPPAEMHDWEQVLFISLCRAMGMKVNADAMEHMAQLIPLNLLRRNAGDEPFAEAMFFGVAGMLQDPPGDDHQYKLQQQWQFIKHKYSVAHMQAVEWKYARMHPPNFPDIRIAQMAQLYCRQQSFLQTFLAAPGLDQIRSHFEHIQLGSYWLDHFRLGHPPTAPKAKKPGRDTIDILIMNAIVPVLFIYAYSQNNTALQEQIISILETMPPEKNKIIRDWEAVGIKAANAADSQALLQLRNEYCDARRCLQCSIGHQLLKQGVRE